MNRGYRQQIGRDATSAQDGSDAETVLRRMMTLTDDIIAEVRPIDSVCTFILLMARHELTRRLAEARSETVRL